MKVTKKNLFKNKLLKIMIILFTAVIFTSPLINAESTWYINNFNAQKISQDSNILTLDIDSSGTPQISFIVQKTLFLKNLTYKYPLNYAFIDANGDFTVYTADEKIDYGPYISMDLDSRGIPHVAVYEKETENLRYMTIESGTWVGFTLDESGDVGLYCSIAMDSKDQPHISYHLNSNPYGLKYATYDRDENKWTTELIDPGMGVGTYTSIAVDKNDNPRITYFDFFHNNKSIRYAYFTGQKWNFESIDYQGNVGYGSSLAIDTKNVPHVTYQDATNSSVKYAYRTGLKQWQIETVYNQTSVARQTSLVLDSNNNPHIAFTAFPKSSELKYAYKIDELWEIKTVTNGLNPSLALNENNIPSIVYFSNYGINFTTPKLMIKKPIIDMTFSPGEICEIEWISTLNEDHDIKIELYKNNSVHSILSPKVSNMGSFIFKISEEIPQGIYIIKMTDIDNDTIFATTYLKISHSNSSPFAIYPIFFAFIIVSFVILFFRKDVFKRRNKK